MQDKNPKSLFGIDINEYTQNVQFDILATQIDFLYLRSSGSATGSFRVDTRFLEYARLVEIMEFQLEHIILAFHLMI